MAKNIPDSPQVAKEDRSVWRQEDTWEIPVGGASAGGGLADAPISSRQDNRRGWQAYLGDTVGGAAVSPYAAASLATDLSNLPPA